MSAGDAERFIGRNLSDMALDSDESHRQKMVALGDKLRREGSLTGRDATDYRRVGARGVYEHYLTASMPDGSPMPTIHPGSRDSCSNCSGLKY
jgi:hypothetical protein